MLILVKPGIRKYILYRCLNDLYSPPKARRGDLLNQWICQLESISARVNDLPALRGITDADSGNAVHLSLDKRDIVYFILYNTALEDDWVYHFPAVLVQTGV